MRSVVIASGIAVLAVSLALFAAVSGQADEASLRFEYSTFEMEGENCRPKRFGAEGEQVCDGLYDYVLHVIPHLRELRFVHIEALPAAARDLSVKPDPESRPGSTVEWVIRKQAGEPEDLAWRPVAAILRFHGPGKAQKLAVIRLSPGNSCLLGYVDARIQAQANEVARQAALDRAESFVCGRDQPAEIAAAE